MITEYTDCTEFMRLIADQKIKPSAVKRYLSKQGIVMTATNAEIFANDVYTIMLGGQEILQITQMIVGDGNYEKSTLINAKLRNTSEDKDILNFFVDNFNYYRSSPFRGYTIEQPIKSDSELFINMSYKRKLPGKNKLIQEETRHIKVIIRKKNPSEVSIDIRQPSSFDAQKVLDLLKQMTEADENSEVFLAHLNMRLLTEKNKVDFFDKLSLYPFKDWKLKTVTGLTVRKPDILDDDDLDDDTTDDESPAEALAVINQAVLNGSGLRSNEFVQKSLEQGYYISSMKYRYMCIQEAGEFIVSINSKGENLRVDIDKSYYDEDGRMCVQPFPKNQQDEIIRVFQEACNEIFYLLIEDQKKRTVTTENN